MVSIKRFCLLCIFMAMSPVWASVTAHVDRSEIYDDETLQLTVTVSPIADLEQSDLEALKTLFEITQYYPQQYHQTINGRSRSSASHIFQLRPKQKGNLSIPNFHIGNDQSQPILISVLDSSKRQDGLPDDAVILTAALDTNNPYVDQSIRLTIELQSKINFSQGASLSSLELDPDEFDATLIDTKDFNRNVGNSTVQVYQRIIELTPKKPGIFHVPDIRFSGQYPSQRLGRYVRVSRSASIDSIEVRPIPSEFPASAFWLPASNLSLTDNLLAPLSVKTNEHLEWRMTANIQGLNAKRLPDLFSTAASELPDSIKQYKNNPIFADGQRTDSTALVFTQPGETQLPEVRIPWWNTQTDTLEWATLPSRSVEVTGSVTTAQPMSVTPAATPAVIKPQPIDEKDSSQEKNLWKLTTILFAVLWLATFAVLIWRWQKTPARKTSVAVKPSEKITVPDSPETYYQAIIHLLKNGQGRASLLPSEQDILTSLETHLFKSGDVPDEKQLKALWKAAQNLKVAKTEISSNSGFELYQS